jgi:hypothetical protein
MFGEYMNRILVVSFGLIFFISCTTTQHINKIDDNEKIECLSLEHCLGLVSTVSSDSNGTTFRERYFAEQFAQFGEPALIALLELSHSKKNGDRKIAGIGISHFDEINEKYLDAIADGIDRDVSWLPNALSKIRTEKAAKIAVEKYLISGSAPHNQEANAVRAHGVRALPFLLDAAQCGEQCGQKTLYLAAYIVGEMDKKARQKAIRSTVDKVLTSGLSESNQRNLLYLMTKLGPAGRIVEDDLLTIRNERPVLEGVIDMVFIGIHSKYSGSVFASLIEKEPDNYLLLRDVAEMGPAAGDAGPIITQLMEHPESKIRVNAVRALGFLKFKPAEKQIISILQNSNDIQLAWVSATALGMIGLDSSLDSLQQFGLKHWYPAVRDASELAMELIKSKKDYDSNYHKNNFAFDFFQYDHLNVKGCENVSINQIEESSDSKLYKRQAEKQLKALQYDSYILSYGASDEEEQNEKDPDGIIEVNQYNMVEHREDIKQIPDFALRVNDGWLTGSSRGEWGGELVYIPDDGKAVKLMSENIKDVYEFGDRYVVVGGLAHLGMNRGMIYSVLRNAGEWHVEPWLNLPGAPESSWFVETGELLVNTYGGGTILINANGNLRMAPCDKYEVEGEY